MTQSDMQDGDQAFLQLHLPGFAGYGDEAAVTSTDEHVRAYVGEALARLRLGVDGCSPAELDRLDRVLLLCEFADLEYIEQLRGDDLSDGAVAWAASLDRQLVESVSPRKWGHAAGDVKALLDRLESLFRARRQSRVEPPRALP